MSRPMGFLVYDSYKEQIMRLDDRQAGALLKALVLYHTENREPEFSDAVVDMAFSFIRSQLRRDEEKWEKLHEIRSEQGRKGGAPKGNKNACKNKQNDQNKPDKNKDKDQDKDQYQDKDEDKEKSCAGKQECFSRVELSEDEQQELVRLSDSLTVKRFISKLSQWQQKHCRRSDKAYIVIRGWIEEQKQKTEGRAEAIKPDSSQKHTSFDIDAFERFARGFDLSKQLKKQSERNEQA